MTRNREPITRNHLLLALLALIYIVCFSTYTEFELSAQDQADEPPDALYESIMLTTHP